MFLDERCYLLKTGVGRDIFFEITALPIVDGHSHINAADIATNRGWEDIWEVEGSTDHYVWELMRRCGVPEEKITGNASNLEKWQALANVFPRFAGNPVYDWIHLDLQRRFNIKEPLNSKTCMKIWDKTKEMLSLPQFKPQSLIKEMNVACLCTTENPLSDLKWHAEIRENFPDVKVLPSWRPDDVMHIGSQEWRDFVVQLGEQTGVNVARFTGLLEALEKTHRYFARYNCVTSDHAVIQPWGHYVSERTAARIYQKAYHGQAINAEELRDFQAFLLHFFAEMDAAAGWIMQLHIGAVRDYRDLLFRSLGRDSGGDVASHDVEFITNLRDFLNDFDGRLQIILYVLHPSHTYTCATLARAFPNLYIGASWWFMDNPYHMREQFATISQVDLFVNYAGMVTDSRKLFALGARTEMFRRVLADFLGDLVEEGRVPSEVAVTIAQEVAYHRPNELFLRRLQ